MVEQLVSILSIFIIAYDNKNKFPNLFKTSYNINFRLAMRNLPKIPGGPSRVSFETSSATLAYSAIITKSDSGNIQRQLQIVLKRYIFYHFVIISHGNHPASHNFTLFIYKLYPKRKIIKSCEIFQMIIKFDKAGEL